MPIESERPASHAASGPTAEVRPEELSELLDRLHRRAEGVTVADVAEALGLSPEEVQRALGDVRAGARKEEVVPPRKRRKRRHLGAAIAVLLLIGGGVLVSAERTRLRARMMPGVATRVSAADNVSEISGASAGQLRDRLTSLLPQGMSVTIDNVQIAGESQNRVFPQADVLQVVLELARRQADIASTAGRINRAEIFKELKSRTPVAVSGVTFVRIAIDRGNSGAVVYLPAGPGASTSLGSEIDRWISSTIRQREEQLSTHLSSLGRPSAP